MAIHLAQVSARRGTHLDNLVLHDLLGQRGSGIEQVDLLYRRTSIGEEVDSVVASGGSLLHMVKSLDVM